MSSLTSIANALYPGPPETLRERMREDIRALLLQLDANGLRIGLPLAEIVALFDGYLQAKGLSLTLPALPTVVTASVRAWHPPIAPLRRDGGPGCPECGSIAWATSRAEKRHHERVHAGEASLRELYPGLLTSYIDREAAKADAPSKDAPREMWTIYVLNVIWAYYSREVRGHYLGQSGKILKVRKHFVAWPNFVARTLLDFTIALLRGEPYDHRLYAAAEHIPHIFTCVGINEVRRLLSGG